MDGLRDDAGDDDADDDVDAAGDGDHADVVRVSPQDFPSPLSPTCNCEYLQGSVMNPKLSLGPTTRWIQMKAVPTFSILGPYFVFVVEADTRETIRFLF